MMNAINYCAAARIKLSRLTTVPLIVALCITSSSWTQTQPIVGTLLGFTGWLLVGVGVIGRIWAGSYICGCKNVKLMMDGPYSMCRNPLYLFSFIGGLGAMLVTQTLLFPVLFALVFLIYYHQVMRNEEQILHSLHGSSFESYRRDVPLFWPRRIGFTEPEHYSMSAQQFRRFLIEVIWFIVVAAVVQVVHQLQINSLLPTLFLVR